MDTDNKQFIDPNFVPEEFQVPYDIIELPSQGLLYKNKQKKIKIEYLTAMDENILSSPNISAGKNILDILLNRKIKDLGFDPQELLAGDRLAILIYLRVTGFGEKLTQMVFDTEKNKLVEGEIDLSTLEQKNLTVKPDKDGLFDYELPSDKTKVKFKLLTTKDEKYIEERDQMLQERSGEDISFIPTLRLEQSIKSLGGVTDPLKIAHSIGKLKIMDIRKLNKYITDI